MPHPGASPRRARWLAWGSCGLGIALLAVGIAFSYMLDGSDLADYRGQFPLVLFGGIALLSFPIIGALIAARRPEHRIGWLFCGAGLAWALYLCADGYAAYGLVRAGGLPGAALAGWLGEWLVGVDVFIVVILMLLLFPDGRLLSPSWRWAVVLTVLGLLGWVLSFGFRPGVLVDYEPLRNPFGVPGLGRELVWVGSVASKLLLAMVPIAAVSSFLRLRRSRGEERQQLKWFAYAAVMTGLTYAVLVTLAATTALSHAVIGAIAFLAIMGMPLAAAVAILRYRLYAIDRIVNRTLVYGVLTAMLGLIYVGSVLLLQMLAHPLTRGSDVSIAVSTLAVAALFQPARRRVQGTVDRRFYRRAYDATRLLAAFSAAARQEVDRDHLAESLARVITEAVQPEHVSIWLGSQVASVLPVSGAARVDTGLSDMAQRSVDRIQP